MKFMIILTALSVLLIGPAARACEINGIIEADMNPDQNGLGIWKYTLTVTWDTDHHGVSHIDLLVDDGVNCDGQDLVDGLAFEDIVGTSDGDPSGCTVEYFALLEGNGDATHPDIDGPIIKFEYVEDQGCEPASTGTAVLCFYSDYPPGDIDEPNLFIADKHAQDSASDS